MTDGERSLAVFIDFENLALGFQGRRDRFDIERVLERIVEKGKIVAKKAYADWSRFLPYTAPLHEAAIELIEIPRRAQSGKNSADIRLCVDAMDLAYSKDHIDTFVIVSGDSDFSPLVSKLKENGKHVIGLGMQESTSELLRDNCDEFIYYEDLGKAPALAPKLDAQVPETKRKAIELLLESLLALRRENKEILWGSMVKDTMKRKKPSFNESYHGYRTFSELLEDAQKQGLLELETDKRSRTYVVTRFGAEMSTPVPAAMSSGKKKGRRRRSGKKARPGERANGEHATPTPAAAVGPAPGEASPAEAVPEQAAGAEPPLGAPPAEEFLETAATPPAPPPEAFADLEPPPERPRRRPRPAPAVRDEAPAPRTRSADDDAGRPAEPAPEPPSEPARPERGEGTRSRGRSAERDSAPDAPSSGSDS